MRLFVKIIITICVYIALVGLIVFFYTLLDENAPTWVNMIIGAGIGMYMAEQTKPS